MRKVLLLEEAEQGREEMLQLMEMKTRLIRGISHDLKNPLGAADGYAALLEEGIGGELRPEQQEYVHRIRRTHRSMLEIIQNLLEHARTETGDLILDTTDTELAGLVREAVENYRGMAEIAGLELDLEIEDGLPTIRTDAVRVREVLGNLLSKATKYTPGGGHVHVRAGLRSHRPAPDTGSWIAVEVEDSGPGISLGEQEKIFEEFHRLEPDTTRGAGIGLATGRRMARRLGGDITVRSRPGEGSTFTMWLRSSEREREVSRS